MAELQGLSDLVQQPAISKVIDTCADAWDLLYTQISVDTDSSLRLQRPLSGLGNLRQ